MANWYAYTGIGDPTVASSYRLTSIKPSCLTGEEICAIYLNQSAAIPSTFDGVTTYIANALATQSPQPSGLLVKPFVYLRGPVS